MSASLNRESPEEIACRQRQRSPYRRTSASQTQYNLGRCRAQNIRRPEDFAELAPDRTRYRSLYRQVWLGHDFE